MTSLAQVLARIGLLHYQERLEAEGFDSWETLLDIQESDFEALGIKLGHRRRIQREIATARGIALDAALPSSQRDLQLEDRTPESDDRGNLANDSEDSRQSQSRTGKRKYVRHPKDDENAPEKAPSAYVLFSNKVREEVKGQDLSFTEIAKLVGQRWQQLTPAEQEPFKAQAESAKEKRRLLMEEYKKTEQYREYERYLADFRAKNKPASKPELQGDGKRPRLEHHQGTSSGSTTTASTGYSPHSPSQPSSAYLSRSQAESFSSLSSRSYAQPPRVKTQGGSMMTPRGLQSPIGGSSSPRSPFATREPAASPPGVKSTIDGRDRQSAGRSSLEPHLPPPNLLNMKPEESGWRGEAESARLPPIAGGSVVAGIKPLDPPRPVHPPLLTPPMPGIGKPPAEAGDRGGASRAEEKFSSAGIQAPKTLGSLQSWPHSPEDAQLRSPYSQNADSGPRIAGQGSSAPGLADLSGLSLLSKATALAKSADQREDEQRGKEQRRRGE